ncbi:HNH endonuclease [Phyllobacterium brassicacearum]|nr:HNH endonuclease signature motif containing protein [Phyllobacterium brassicacearum]TDQ24141.1 HNH endonuclease [Phyllobacterium brassicacearum]
MKKKAWTFLAITGRWQYAGNAGYNDQPGRIYEYDSAVGNSRHVHPGDIAVLRDGRGMLGIGIVADVRSGPGHKQRFRCPACGSTAIKDRRTMLPRYRCGDAHVFDQPVSETVSVMKYAADFGGSFVGVSGIDATTLRKAVLRPSTQKSIEEIDASKIAPLVAAMSASAGGLFEGFFQGWNLDNLPPEVDEEAYQPSSGDRREAILRAIRARNGQSKFKTDLIRRYGAQCMISACTLMPVVEAAHIWPYRGPEDNHPANGLLLRADLHTLYDLDLLGISPETFEVETADGLLGSDYASHVGTKLLVSGKAAPSREALALRWAAFQQTKKALLPI